MHTCGELNQIVIDFLKRICDLTFYKLEVYSKNTSNCTLTLDQTIRHTSHLSHVGN